MDRNLILLPQPRHLNFNPGVIKLSQDNLILLDCEFPHTILFSAAKLQNSLLTLANFNYEIYAGKAITDMPGEIILCLKNGQIKNSQGYDIKITPVSICVEASHPQGIFYGCCTLIQIIQNYLANPQSNSNIPHLSIPCLEVMDWPDFVNRGVMLDISRDKVPTMETIFNLTDLLASWKINQLQLYTEHTFAYKKHPEVWADASPFTGEEILILDSFCRERFIELVPNQNSFGHLKKWLIHPRYLPLAEAPEGFDFPWEHHAGPFSLCPLNPKSIKLVGSMYDELLPHFSSRQINVGCDETFDLGKGYSKDECEKIGTGRVYLDFVHKIYNEVTKHGSKMQFWGDMVLKYPNLIAELPKDCIALEWGYEFNHPFDEHCEKFAQSGLPFYVCPGTSSWNSIAGRTDNCTQNLASAASSGQKFGAEGYLITDWGDNGHWQMLPVSYLGFLVGAAYSWSLQSNNELDIIAALNYFAFQDSSNNLGRIAYNLGNIYREAGVNIDNGSVLFEILQKPIIEWKDYLPAASAIKILNRIIEIIITEGERISIAQPNRLDTSILIREFQLTKDLLLHACNRGIYAFGAKSVSKSYLLRDIQIIISEYQEIWLCRNRSGGLKDSLENFNTALQEYE